MLRAWCLLGVCGLEFDSVCVEVCNEKLQSVDYVVEVMSHT